MDRRVRKKDSHVGMRAEERSVVVAGSVWESRMKVDQVRGGFKVFNGEEGSAENEAGSATRLKKAVSAGGAATGKRKMWKPEFSDGLQTNPIQIERGKTDLQKNCDEKCNELSVSAEGFKKNTIQVRKSRSEGNTQIISAINKIERSSIHARKARSEFAKGFGESSARTEKHSGQNRKLKPDSEKMTKTNKSSDSIENNLDAESEKNSDKIERNQMEICANRDEETSKEFDASEIKISRSSESEVEEDDDYEEENGEDGEKNNETEIKIEEKNCDINRNDEPESKQIIHQAYEKSTPTICAVKQKYSSLNQSPSKHCSNSDEDNIDPENHSKLQSLVDLVMWRDPSRSAFVFGIGTFVIISSSYTNDINISFISVISYLGLVYLAAIFLYRSIVCRGALETDGGERSVVGEEEALWFVKLFLPYLNEFLLKLSALFCGDPGTTIKLAALLFVSAKCGSTITIWKLAKWGFFGVFTLPKVGAYYSSHFANFATFWSRRLKDAWISCSHKKGVAIAVFIVVWNLSSAVARIWAVFMFFVALKYYQQSLASDAWVEDKGKFKYTGEPQVAKQTSNRRPRLGDHRKTKKSL